MLIWRRKDQKSCRLVVSYTEYFGFLCCCANYNNIVRLIWQTNARAPAGENVGTQGRAGFKSKNWWVAEGYREGGGSNNQEKAGRRKLEFSLKFRGKGAFFVREVHGRRRWGSGKRKNKVFPVRYVLL